MTDETAGEPASPETDAIDALAGRIRNDLDALAYAVWMVGNMDTPEDKAAWWRDFEPIWQAAARRVEAMKARGVTCDAGFAATGLAVPST